MSLEQVNHYILVPIALFAVLLYLAMVFAGLGEFVARKPKRNDRPQRRRSGKNARNVRNGTR